MDFVKENWTSEDFKRLNNYAHSIKSSENDCMWEQRITNTNLECFGRTSTKAREIVKQIKKGNYLDFLDKVEITNHLESIVCAFLISNIKDFDTFEKYLDKFVITIDNWASCDTLRFKNKEPKKLLTLAHKYLKSKLPFVRRVGLDIFLELIKSDEYLDDAFSVINSLKDETEYYVNICAAWLLSFCFIYSREKTLEFYKTHNTNKFIINKSISKCRESFRVEKSDKDFLIKFKM